MSQSRFSTRVLVLMAIGIALNMALGQLVTMLKLPVYLDSLGTMLVALLFVYTQVPETRGRSLEVLEEDVTTGAIYTMTGSNKTAAVK